MSLQFDDIDYLERLRQLPNAQLHLHWDGCIPFEFLWDHYKDQGRKLYLPERHLNGEAVKGDREIKSLAELVQFRDGLLKQWNIGDVFDVSVMAMQTREELKTMAIAACEYLSSQNTFYAELRFAPWLHSQYYERGTSKLSLNEVIEASLKGFEEGERQFGVNVKPTICITRDLSPDDAKKVVEAALNFQYDGKRRGVVGIDLAGYEPSFPPELFSEAFSTTFGSNLKRTIHADEMVDKKQGVKNLYTSLFGLRADGIGHGIHLHELIDENPDLIQIMKILDIRLESNPISVLTTGFVKDAADLHLDKLVESGVKVTVNADDPAMWPNGDPAHSLYVVGKLYGDKFVETVLRNSIDSAWGLSEQGKLYHNELLTINLKSNGFIQ